MRNKIIIATILCYLQTTLQPVFAFSIGGWKPLKTFEKVVTAPTKIVINTGKVIIDGKKPETILDPAKDAVKSVSPIPKIAADVSTWPQTQIYKEARKAVAKSGKGGELIFDIATFYDNYQLNITKASGQVSSSILNGQDPLLIAALPLAAAIREAEERHKLDAKPLPENVKKGLSSIYSKETLNRARYVVGNIEITLPNIIGKTFKFMGDEYGVVVGDIIVFSSDPKEFWDNPFWWGHEVKHVEQYSKWGIEEFSLKYIKNYKDNIERPADDDGERARLWAINNQLNYGKNMTDLASKSYFNHKLNNSEPLIQKKDLVDSVKITDPVVVQFFFPNDLPIYEYYGTQSGKIIVKDASTGAWMQIGWAIPPDIAGPSWIYHVPNKGNYDVFPDGRIMLRYSHYGTPIQVGYVGKIQY